MNAREWTHVDKRGWGPGAWQGEPDKIQWVDGPTGLDCLMVRQPSTGHWCGYVGVPEGHPTFEKDYDNVRIGPCLDDDHWTHEPSCYIEVHGGLTFAGPCQEDAEEGHGVCHVAEPGRPERIWWLGFDCAHLRDLSPARRARKREHGWPTLEIDLRDVYRDRAYVEAEVVDLARQLASLAAPA